MKTRVTSLMWMALSLRGHVWHKYDVSGNLQLLNIFPILVLALQPAAN
jgi:hypothetical protein